MVVVDYLGRYREVDPPLSRTARQKKATADYVSLIINGSREVWDFAYDDTPTFPANDGTESVRSRQETVEPVADLGGVDPTEASLTVPETCPPKELVGQQLAHLPGLLERQMSDFPMLAAAS